jgi:hypothetical protein
MTQHCAQCNASKPKYVFECPRCGAQPDLPRTSRLLFDVPFSSSQAASSLLTTHPTSITEVGLTPSTSKPLWVDYERRQPIPGAALLPDTPSSNRADEGLGLIQVSSFWPIVSVLLLESLFIYLINMGIAVVASAILQVPTYLIYSGETQWLAYSLHLACSWMAILAPVFFINQTPFMPSRYLHVPCRGYGQVILFSGLHLLSVICLPITYVFMLFDQDHRTPTEAWLGLPILQSSRMG